MSFIPQASLLTHPLTEIASVKEQQRQVVTSLRTLQAAPTRFVNDLAQAEALIERFWYLEEHLAS